MGKWRYKKKSKIFTYRQRTGIDDVSRPTHCDMEQKTNTPICYLCGNEMIIVKTLALQN